ncbi:MAG TPA: iron-sulfur cluster-binding domain-containing protein [Stenotrophomonas sp.]|jgi:ferredoxin-NADP reductase
MSALAAPVAPRPAWISPAFFDFWAGRLNPLWTWNRPRARLLARRPEGASSVTLLLQANRHWRGCLPGQHVELGIEMDGRRLCRHYSPTVLGGGRFEITIKTLADGRVSPHLAAQAQIGDVFELGQAFGEMVLPAGAVEPLLLLAAGSGITPMRALLREWKARGANGELTLMYWSRDRAAACFGSELEALATLPNVRVVQWITSEGAPRIGDLSAEALGPSQGKRILACGPGGFVQAASDRLAGDALHFQGEAFSPMPAITSEEGEVEVQLARSGRRLRLPRALSLLEGLEAQGLRPRHGCRMGICNTCACTRQSGTTRHLPSGQRHHEPAEVRLCVHAPSTDLVLDL